MNNRDEKFEEFFKSKLAALMKTREGMVYASNQTVQQLFYNDAVAEFDQMYVKVAESHIAAKKAISARRNRNIKRKRPIICH